MITAKVTVMTRTIDLTVLLGGSAVGVDGRIGVDVSLISIESLVG